MVLIFSGPTTIGKDRTWVRVTEQLGFKKYVPFTTRKIRVGEQDGIDYHFVSTQAFQDMIRDRRLLEWDFFDGNYYGTDTSILLESKSHNIVLHALARIALRIRTKLDNTNLVMLLPADEAVLRKRMQERGYTGSHLAVRFSHYEEEKTHAPLFDHIVPDAETLTDFEAEQIIKKIIDDVTAQEQKL